MSKLLGLAFASSLFLSSTPVLSSTPHRPGARSAPSTPAPEQAETVLRYSPETLDLGEMTVGQPKSGTLTVTNAGAAPITIESMKGGCGCTKVSDPPKAPIAPGASFSVEITLDPGKKGGVELVKPVHTVLAGGRVETIHIKARVRAVVALTPAVIDASDPSIGSATISLKSVDGAAFKVTGAMPAGIVDLSKADAPAMRFDLSIDLAAWEKAGRPATVVLATDREGAREIIVPVKSAEAVVMFRLPSAASDAAERASVEATQDGIIRDIDERLVGTVRSERFRMRLHRESGMLFVHGSEGDLAAVRAAVAALPSTRAVRESYGMAGG
jgi:hypothetical protein